MNTGVLVTELGVQSAGDVQGYTGLYQHPDTVSFQHRDGRGRERLRQRCALTLSQPARPGQRVTLDYGGTQLRDHTNRLVPGFQQLEVTNVTGGAASVAPAPVRGSAAGSHAEAGVQPGAGRGLGADGGRLPGLDEGPQQRRPLDLGPLPRRRRRSRGPRSRSRWNGRCAPTNG